jgi:hypothetical protein
MCRPTILIALLCAGCSSARTSETPAPSPGPATAPGAPPAAAGSVTVSDSVARERERYVAEVMKSIAGKEQQPASQVFKNVKMLTNVPAARLLAVMNIGYGKSLGVSCTHCHVAGEWDSDAKPQKQIARDMSAMSATINNQLLRNIPNLKGPSPVVNCTTCHRGQVKPALNLP